MKEEIEMALRAERDKVAERMGELNQELARFPRLCWEVVSLQERYKCLTETLENPPKEIQDESDA